MSSPSDPTREAALRLMARLLADGQDALTCEAGGVTMHVHVHIPDPDADLTPCERDLLMILGEESPRLRPGPWLMRELAKRDLIHGESTVKRALARLVRCGRITNSPCVPRGYRLAAS